MFITYIKNTFLQQQLSFEDFYNAVNQNTIVTNNITEKPIFKTFQVETLVQANRALFEAQTRTFEVSFTNRLIQAKKEDMSTEYTTFRIPKHSGGFRTINAPNDELKTLLSDINKFFIKQHILSHNSAYAYVPQRCIKDAITIHQARENKCFLKIDLHDFFGSCNKPFIKRQLNQIPFFHELNNNTLELLLDVCMLNNGLPQGSPLSPWLTNQIMLPIDYKLNKLCKEHNITYTRYADDMLFSANSRNAVMHAKPLLENCLQNTPLHINEEKTKVSSIYGQNWNLGLMLNKDNQITVGYRKKERFRATLNTFCQEYRQWHYQEATELLGKLEYYYNIEPIYFRNILTKYGEKYNINIRAKLIDIIKNNA